MGDELHGLGQSMSVQTTQYAFGPTRTTNETRTSTDNKVSQLSHEQFKILQENYEKNTTSPPKAIGEDRSAWQKVVATTKELDGFTRLVKPGGAFRSIIDDSLEKVGAKEKSHLHKDDIADLKDILDETNPITGNKFVEHDLPNGEFLEVEEQQAIFLYSSHLYNIFNNTLGKKDNYLKDFMQRNDIPPEKMSDLKNLALDMSTVIASAVNKLPSYEGPLYRGTAFSNEELEGYKEGKVTVDPKFLSYSTDPSVSKEFAEDTAKSKNKISGKVMTPTIFVIQSSKSKDISEFSVKAEAERLYAPGQAFESLGVTKGEDELEGFAIITLREINIA